MAVSPQLLVAGLVVGGVGIGVPVYLVTAKNSFVTSPSLVQFISEVTKNSPQFNEFSQKINCNTLDSNEGGQVSEKFLEERGKEKASYSLAFCSNTNIEGKDHSLLGKSLSLLFPKDVLSKIPQFKVEGGIEMNIQTTIGKKNSRDFVTSVFSNSSASPSIKVRWVDLLNTKNLDSQKVIVTLFEQDDQKTEEIYILIGSEA